MLSVDAVAERLGLSSKTVRRIIESGELTIHRIGRRVLIAEGDLDAFVNRHRA
jgi:excisionase family DNA binding protein